MNYKEQLIQNINDAFAEVKLEDGIGLWEAQGLDDYATKEECNKLRAQDIKDDWHKIPVMDLYKCSSSLSFFDAKGMRFHLPQFLLFDLDVFEKQEEKLHKNGELASCHCPDIYFTLTYKLENDYSVERFSALNNKQIQCVIDYLNYQIMQREAYYNKYGIKSQQERDEYYNEIKEAIKIWQEKLKQLKN